MRALIAAALFGVGFSIQLHADEVLNVCEDASVKMSDPNVVFGQDERLFVHCNKQNTNLCYLKFDGSKLGKVADIVSMEAFALANTSARGSDVYLLTDKQPWNENAITWNNAPGNDRSCKDLLPDSGLKIGEFSKPEKGVSQTVGFLFESPAAKEALVDALNSDSHVVSLVMVRSGERFQTYASRESSADGSHPVRMTVSCDPDAYIPPVIQGKGSDQEYLSKPENVLIQSPVITLMPAGKFKPEMNPPTLRWPISLGPPPYTIILGQADDLKDGVLQKSVSGTFLRPFKAFVPGQWYWKVVAANGAESEMASFVITDDLPVWEIPSWETLLSNVPQGHPRTYVRPDDLPRLRALTCGSYSNFLAEAERDCLKKFVGKKIPDLPDSTDKWFGKHEKNYVNGPVRCLEKLHFVYQMTQDSRYADEIRRRALHFAKFTPEELAHPRRNDFANSWMIASLAYAYDTIYDQWTPEERNLLAGRILERIHLGMDEFMPGRIHDQQQINSDAHSWQWTLRNMTIGALALYSEYPEARQLFEWSLKIHVALYPWFGGRDGGSAENAQYFQYTGFTTAAETAALFGEATGLNFFEKPWYQNAMWYLMYSQGLGAQRSQFGDHREFTAISDKGYLGTKIFSGKVYNPYFTAYWQELQELYAGERDELSWFSMILEPYQYADPEPLSSLPKARLFSGIGVVMMRSDFMKPERDILFEFKSGPYGSVDHNHADLNSFNISAYGEPLVLDSGHYDSYGSKHHTEWTSAMRGHNTVLVDDIGAPRRSWESHGQITDFEIGDGFVRTAGSAGPAAYKGVDVKQFDRQILWLEPDTWLIVDSLATGEPRTFQWLLHAVNEMQMNESAKTLMLQTDKAEARVRFFAPNRLAFSQTDQFSAPPEKGNPNQKDQQMPNQWHFTASTVKPEKKQQFITVIQVCPKGEVDALPEPVVTQAQGQIVITLSDSRKGTLNIQK